MHPILLFDGQCLFCQGAVKFIIKRDPKANYRFASLQSETGQDLLDRFGLPGEQHSTFILIEDDRIYSRSTAALKVAKNLSFPWPLLYAFVVIPSVLRDPVYRLIASNRYRWFGQADSCMIPTPEIAQRFLP